jgi:hypothetical protein
MENMKVSVSGKKLTIVIEDLTKDLGPSQSGKTHIIATTHGPVPVPKAAAGVSLNVNLYKKVKKA